MKRAFREMVELTNIEKTTTSEKISNTHTAELVFGICAPIGSKKEKIITFLKKQLTNEYGYTVKVIKLSEYIEQHCNFTTTIEKGKSESYTSLMNKIKGGNHLRKEYNNPAFLAELAINEIYKERYEECKKEVGGKEPEVTDYKSRRICYIIDSLKHPKELSLLRLAYQDLFYLISIFSPKSERKEYLRDEKKLNVDEVDLLINTDEYEDNNNGQNVRATFVGGDLFIRSSKENQENIEKNIIRFLHLIFESEIITPTKNEIAMYQAKSASGNSACLSRQVGACITNRLGDVISTGWNDVPKYGGNLYREEDKNDDRCKVSGYCRNDQTKDKLTEEILSKIEENTSLLEYLKENIKIHDFLTLLSDTIRKSSRVKDLIEFSRSVHAEMHAIIVGCQQSADLMVGGKLFCTTYPCHNCARHIIAAGITEIYYIEPYIKSLCIELHSDAITEDEKCEKKVRILLYDGISPSRFLDFFSLNLPRKNKTGRFERNEKKSLFPKSKISLQAIPTLETQAFHSLNEIGYDPTKKHEI